MATEVVRWVDGVQDGSAESNRWTRRDDPSTIQRCDEEPSCNHGRGSCVYAVCLYVPVYVCVYAIGLDFPRLSDLTRIFDLNRAVWQSKMVFP